MEAKMYEGLAEKCNEQAQIKWYEYVRWFKEECTKEMEEQQMEEQVARQRIYDKLSEILQESRDKIKRRTTDMIKVFDRLSKLDERMVKELNMKGLKSLIRLSEKDFKRICNEIQGKIEAEDQQQREETPMISDEDIIRMIMIRFNIKIITPEITKELQRMINEGKRINELNIWMGQNLIKEVENETIEIPEEIPEEMPGNYWEDEPMSPILID